MHPKRKSNVAVTLQTKDKDNRHNTEGIWVFKDNKHWTDWSQYNAKEQNCNKIWHCKHPSQAAGIFLDEELGIISVNVNEIKR